MKFIKIKITVWVHLSGWQRKHCHHISYREMTANLFVAQDDTEVIFPGLNIEYSVWTLFMQGYQVWAGGYFNGWSEERWIWQLPVDSQTWQISIIKQPKATDSGDPLPHASLEGKKEIMVTRLVMLPHKHTVKQALTWIIISSSRSRLLPTQGE